MTCWSGFGNLLDGQHPVWLGDFTGVGRTQVLFYYSGDGHWWLGDDTNGQIAWSLVSQSAGFGNLLDGRHPIWLGDFTGVGRTQILFYYNGDGHWWLGDFVNGQIRWSLVSQSAGFGNLLDGRHPIWLGDFTGVGRTQILFDYNGDGHWWLGDFVNGQIRWSLVSRSAGFGNLLDGRHPVWLGDFTGVGRTQVLFYYNGDGHWWLGDVVNGQMQWSLASQTAGFGNLLDGRHPIWLGSFTRAGRTQILFYYNGDGHWWLGDFVNGSIQWSLVSQTAGFGNLLDGRHPIWLGDFTGGGRTQVLFYYNGDGHWWLGDFVNGQIQWNLASQSAGFGNLLDGRHPIRFGDFTGAGRTQVLFYYNGDGHWWLGDFANRQIQWRLVSQSAGFGDLLDGRHPTWQGNFSVAGRTQLLFYYNGDGHWWLGDLNAGQLNWSLRSDTGRACDQFIRVHFKTLIANTAAVQTFIDAQYDAMWKLFDDIGIATNFGTVEDLSGDATLANLTALDVANCILGAPTAEQVTLAGNRNNVGADDIVVYVVQSLVSPTGNFLGCAVSPAAQPNAAVVQSAARWLTAHEVAHVLGARHVTNTDLLMNPTVGWTNVPPEIDDTNRTRMRDSALSRNC